MVEILQRKYNKIQDINIALCQKSDTITYEMIVNRTMLVKLKQLIDQLNKLQCS